MIWRCYYMKHGDHVHCRLFCGPQVGALGLLGNLTFRSKEFTEFTKIRRLIAMDFLREIDSSGERVGDDDVIFDDLK